MYRKFKKVVLGLLAHLTASIFFSRILRSVALVYSSYFFFRTAVLRKLFDIRFSYKHCNFSPVCLLVKMASKTVTRSTDWSILHTRACALWKDDAYRMSPRAICKRETYADIFYFKFPRFSANFSLVKRNLKRNNNSHAR